MSDKNGSPVNDAIITLGETTADAGEYALTNVLAGDYPYSVAEEGYITATGSITVTYLDVEETVTLAEVEEPTPMIPRYHLIK